MVDRFIIIGRSSCPYCVAAQDFVSAKKEELIVLDYEEHPEILKEYKKFHNQRTVPIILHNDLNSGKVIKIGGYTDLLEWYKNAEQ